MKMATLTSHPSPDVPESKNCSDPGLVGINRLSLQDTTSGFPKSPSYGQLKPLGIAALVPTITIIFWSIGMGSVLLVWLLAKRISPVPGSPSHIFDGYLVVDEGNKTGSVEELDGEEGLESTMTAVLIITAISHFSTMAVIPLMALGAFYVAAKWLDDQALIKDGPTPLQLGLVMNMCSTGSWNSVTVTSSYLLKHWRTRGQTTHTKVSPLLYSALIICSTIVFLHYGVVFTDLWLTADIGSAYYSMIEEVRVDNSFIASGLGTQWNPDVETWLYIQNGTQGTLSESAISFLKEGLGIFTDRSAKNHIQVINTSTSALIQGTSSMSIIVRPPSGIPPQWSWTAPTIGMTTQCQPAPCRPTVGKDSRESVKSCPEPSGISYPSIPLPSWDYLATFMVRPNPPYFIIERYGPTGVWISQDIPRNMSLEPQANPSYMLLELFFNSDHWNERRDRANLGEALSTWNGVNRIFTLYLGACEMTLYNVEVSFKGNGATGESGDGQDVNSQYTLASPPVRVSDAMAFQMLSLMTSDYGLDYFALRDMLRGTLRSVLNDVVSPGFSTRVSMELGHLCLAYISALNVTHVPASRVTSNSAKLFSRYPLVRISAYIGVVYAHGVLAIILFSGIVRRSSRTIVVEESVRYVNWRGVVVIEKPKPVPELLLVQNRLTDPLAVVAEHFLEPDSENPVTTKTLASPGALSAQEDAIRMFDVETPVTERVGIGIIEGCDGARYYGLRRRKNDVLVTDTEKETEA